MDSDLPSAHHQLSSSTLAESAEKSAANLKALRQVLSICLEEAEQQLKGGIVFVSWDWDAIRGYMFHDSPNEIYGETLVGTLDLGEARRIVILDGARKEMQRYLMQKASYYRFRRLDRKSVV